MQADQTLLSLRPVGGGSRGGRVFGPRSDNAAFVVVLVHLRWTILMIFSWRLASPLQVVSVPEDILKVKQEVDAEFVEDPSWNRGESNVKLDIVNQPPTRYSEPDTRDWRNRSVQSAISADGRSGDTIREARDANQYGRQDFL
ncbi:hypothetical protein Leryth_022252 [Lithospermum erythrorhizon]|nr:hypothetical protein Leryth_022252 [Lithospermum erythrorhizon]